MEVLVSISIIVLLGSTFLANYRDGSKSIELNLAAQKLASDIRFAQNNALGSVKYGATIPDGGWGIHIDIASSSKEYLMFADENGNTTYDIGEADVAKGGRVFTLANNVELLQTNQGNYSDVDIVFLPPDPITTITFSPLGPGPISSSSIAITLKESSQNATRKVNVNYFGLIEVTN